MLLNLEMMGCTWPRSILKSCYEGQMRSDEESEERYEVERPLKTYVQLSK